MLWARPGLDDLQRPLPKRSIQWSCGSAIWPVDFLQTFRHVCTLLCIWSTDLKLKLKLTFANKSACQRTSPHRHTGSSPKALKAWLMIQAGHSSLLETMLYSLLFKTRCCGTTLGLQEPGRSCCSEYSLGYLQFWAYYPVVQTSPFLFSLPSVQAICLVRCDFSVTQSALRLRKFSNLKDETFRVAQELGNSHLISVFTEDTC